MRRPDHSSTTRSMSKSFRQPQYNSAGKMPDIVVRNGHRKTSRTPLKEDIQRTTAGRSSEFLCSRTWIWSAMFLRDDLEQENIRCTHKRRAQHSWRYHNRTLCLVIRCLPEMVLYGCRSPKKHKRISADRSIYSLMIVFPLLSFPPSFFFLIARIAVRHMGALVQKHSYRPERITRNFSGPDTGKELRHLHVTAPCLLSGNDRVT